MALITTNHQIAKGIIPCGIGSTVRWTLAGIDGVATIDVQILNITPTEFDHIDLYTFSYDDATLIGKVTELQNCHFLSPTCLSSSCCDITVDNVTNLSDLSGLADTAPKGSWYFWHGGTVDRPRQVFRYSGSGSPQTLTNWILIGAPENYLGPVDVIDPATNLSVAEHFVLDIPENCYIVDIGLSWQTDGTDAFVLNPKGATDALFTTPVTVPTGLTNKTLWLVDDYAATWAGEFPGGAADKKLRLLLDITDNGAGSASPAVGLQVMVRIRPRNEAA